GRRVLCPKCRAVVRVPAPEGLGRPEDVAQRFTERPPAVAARRRAEPHEVERSTRHDGIREKPRPHHQVVEEVAEELDGVLEVERVEEVDEPIPVPRKKKKRRKKKGLLLPAPAPDEEEEREAPAWTGWAAGVGGIA